MVKEIQVEGGTVRVTASEIMGTEILPGLLQTFRARHSAIDVEIAVSEVRNALTVPSIRTRRAETTVEIPSGGSLAMAGMIQDQTKQTINGLPGLMQLPILGTLFRSRDYINHKTELMILVTPYIVRAVADYYGVNLDQIRSSKRDRAIVVPRQIAMFLIREETDISLLRIGAELGGRDHSTVLHACDKIARELAENEEMRREITAVREMIYSE